MWSAIRSCLSVYLDLSPRGITSLTNTETYSAKPLAQAVVPPQQGPIRQCQPKRRLFGLSTCELCFGRARYHEGKRNRRQHADAKQEVIEKTRAAAQCFAEHSEVHIDHDARDYSDQRRQEIFEERNSGHAQGVILQVKRHHWAQPQRHYDLPALRSDSLVKGTIFLPSGEKTADLVTK